jgi:hypothetical protein
MVLPYHERTLIGKKNEEMVALIMAAQPPEVIEC